MTRRPRGGFRRARARARGESTVASLLVIGMVVTSLAIGFALVATTDVDAETREVALRRAQESAHDGLLLARRELEARAEALVRSRVWLANEASSGVDLTTPFLESLDLEPITIGPTDAVGAGREPGVDTIETETRAWLAAPASRPEARGASKFGGTSSDGFRTDEYRFAYETTSVGRSYADAVSRARETGAVVVRVVVGLTLADAYQKGAADGGGIGGIGDFASAPGEPFLVDAPPTGDTFGPPDWGSVDILGDPTSGQKIYLVAVRGLAGAPGPTSGILRAFATYNGHPLQTKVLYSDRWRRYPNYDAARDALRIVADDGTVSFERGPDGVVALVGPGTGAFYELTGDVGYVREVRSTDPSIELSLDLPGFGIYSAPPSVMDQIRADANKPTEILLSDALGHNVGTWRLVAYGNLSHNPSTGQHRFVGQLGIIEGSNNDGGAIATVPDPNNPGQILEIQLRDVTAVGSGVARRYPFQIDIGGLAAAVDASISDHWNVATNLELELGAQPAVSLFTLEHQLRFSIVGRNASTGVTSVLASNVPYTFRQAMIPGRIATVGGVMPPGRHLRVLAAAAVVLPEARYYLGETSD